MIESNDAALLMGALVAVIGSGGLIGLAKVWGERQRPGLEANAMIISTYGSVVEDLREEIVTLWAEQKRLRDGLLDCHRAHEAALDELDETRQLVHDLQSQMVEFMEGPGR